MKALHEIGMRKALRFGFYTLAHGVMRLLLFPQLRVPFLRMLGASIGRDSIIHGVRLFNLYSSGLKSFRLGEECFIGDDCLFDLADAITMEDQVTLAERVTVITHINVGYQDHPLQAAFPSQKLPVIFRRGCFVGACATILPGVEVGEEALVAAGALVDKRVPPRTVVAGVPARVVRKLGGEPHCEAEESASHK